VRARRWSWRPRLRSWAGMDGEAGKPKTELFSESEVDRGTGGC
jgi:hypothetical protein